MVDGHSVIEGEIVNGLEMEKKKDKDKHSAKRSKH